MSHSKDFVTQIGTSTQAAADWLATDHPVAIPTETVYGLAGNALSKAAVLAIFKAKNRPHFNPLIVHAASMDAAAPYVQHIPRAAYQLAEAFWPGPLTLLLEKHPDIPDLVTAGHHKVAIRVPAHLLTLELLRMLPFPLAAPSANRFGYVSPTTAEHVYDGLNGFIPYILDGGPCTIGVESTIVDFEDQDVVVRRKGGISVENVEAVLQRHVQLRTHAHEHPVAPGQLKSHYATHTPLYTGAVDVLLERFAGLRVAVIAFGPVSPMGADVVYTVNLSSSGNMDEAAANLFACMRQADRAGADVIIAPTLPEAGLGAAINDRLRRARHLG